MDHSQSPAPPDAASGDSESQVQKFTPDPVGGVTALPPRMQCETLATEFAQSWENVAPGDVLAVITIATAVCKILAIVIPLFMGTSATQGWFERKLKHASRKHFSDRSETFHEQFAMELAEFICRLPDNGVSRGEVEAMLSEVQANGTRLARN